MNHVGSSGGQPSSMELLSEICCFNSWGALGFPSLQASHPARGYNAQGADVSPLEGEGCPSDGLSVRKWGGDPGLAWRDLELPAPGVSPDRLSVAWCVKMRSGILGTVVKGTCHFCHRRLLHVMRQDTDL